MSDSRRLVELRLVVVCPTGPTAPLADSDARLGSIGPSGCCRDVLTNCAVLCISDVSTKSTVRGKGRVGMPFSSSG